MTRIFLPLLAVFATTEARLFSISNLFDGNRDRIPIAPGDYKVYWNVPTFMCHKHGFNFDEVASFGIIQNENDKFKGEKVAILYDPGLFPAILKSENGSLYLRNGGVPQEGNLQQHLELFRAHVDEQIDADFSGIGIIDFESWRPIFRQNWASLAPYRDLSVEIEEKKHPRWDRKTIQAQAVRRFETAGRAFVEETIKMAKELRPRASWGYYAYPYCFNLTPQQTDWRCDEKIKADNDNMKWLWIIEDVLMPSVYLRKTLSSDDKVGLVAGRVQESFRLINKFSLTAKVYPYFWYKYQDDRNTLLTKNDLVAGFNAMLENGAQGHIIWGSSNDFQTKDMCREFNEYLNNILGPAVLNLKKSSRYTREENFRESVINKIKDSIQKLLRPKAVLEN